MGSAIKTRCWAVRVVFPGVSGEKPWVQALRESPITLGRSSKTPLHLDDPAVSRQHATLTAEPEVTSPIAWRLNDLNSRNGTRVNGEAVRETVLHEGDSLEVGPYVLTLGVLDANGDWPPDTTADAYQAHRSSATTPSLTVLDDHTANLSRLGHLGRPKVDAQQLRAVQALGRDLLELEDLNARRQRLCAFMVEPGMQGRHAAVLRLVTHPTHAGWTKPTMVTDPVSCVSADQDVYISRSLLDAVIESGEAVMATRSGLEIDGRSDADAPVVALSIAPETQQASVIGCPLPPEDAELQGGAWPRKTAKVMDVLYAVLPDRCGTGEWLALSALAVEQYDLVERAWRARAAAESQAKTQVMLDRARKVQLALVPASPVVEGLELALHFEPCLSVGGDYVDVVTLPDGRTLLLVMDVCGKGMAAALISSSLHTFIHARMSTTSSVVELMNALNLYLCDTMDESTFVTGIAVALDPQTGEAECVNAGHPPAVLVSASAVTGKSQAVTYSDHSDNLPLGLMTEPMVGHTFFLAPNAVLALYSDGLTEIAADGHWIGHEGLADQLAGAMRDNAEATLPAVRDTLNARLSAIQAGSPPDDDMTFLLARRA